MNKRKKITKQNIKDELKPLIPGWIIYILFIVWAYFVFVHYFKIFPLHLKYIDYFFSDLKKFGLSQFNRNLVNYVQSIFIVLCIFISGFGLGNLLLKKVLKFTETKFYEELVLSTGIGVGVLAIMTLFLGLFGLLYRSVFMVIISLLTILAVLQFRRLHPTGFQEERKKITFVELICIGVIIFIMFIDLSGSLTPEIFYDSQFYQLGVLTKWKLEHRIQTSPFLAHTFFPFNVNMLYLTAMILKDEITAKLVNFICGLFVCMSIYVFSKKYFSRETGILAVLIFCSVPIAMVVSVKTTVEIGIGLFVILAIFALTNYFIYPEQKKWLIISGIMTGLALGSKYICIILPYSAIVITIPIIGILEKKSIKKIAGELFIFSITCAVVYAPWWIRNLITSGNPIFPFFWEKIGFLTIKTSGSIQGDLAYPKFTLINYLFFVWPLSMGTLQQETYPGAVFLTFIPFIFLFKQISKPIKYLLIYSFVSIVLWIIFCKFYLRLFIPTLSVISIIFAYYITQSSLNSFFKKLCFFIIIFLATNNLLFVMGIIKSTQDPLKYILGLQDKKEYLSIGKPSYPCPYFQTLDWANKNLKKDSKILFLGETRGCYSEISFVTHGVGDYVQIVEYTKENKTAEWLYNKLKSNGITHFLLNVPEARRLAGYDIFYWDRKDLEIFSEFWNKYVREIYHACSDVTLRGGIPGSTVPQFWNGYIRNPSNYVYLYEIISIEDSKKSHPVPYNFLLEKSLYSEKRWEEIKETAELIKKNRGTGQN